jgi:enoyl-[acyl-carrier protein] reductase II
MVKNKFFNELEEIYNVGRNSESLIAALGRARAKHGMFDGDMEDGELEIGQVSALINEVLPVETVFANLLKEFEEAKMPKF